MKLSWIFSLGVFLTPLWLAAADQALNVRRSGSENDEITNRLRSFYAEPFDPAAMNRGIPKYSAARQDDGQPVSPNSILRFQDDGSLPKSTSPLLRLGAEKSDCGVSQSKVRVFFQERRSDDRLWGAANVGRDRG